MKQRTPPQNLEAEVSILGACLVHQEAVPIAVQGVQDSDFYTPSHRLIFKAMVDLFNLGLPVDQISVPTRLMESGEIQKAGGVSYIAGLTDQVIGYSGVAHACKVVRDAAKSRKAIDLASKVLEQCYSGAPVQHVVEDFSLDFAKLAADGERGKAESLAKIVPGAIAEVKARVLDGLSYGIPTGFADIDRRIAGLARQDLIILAARPSMGKTALAGNIMANVAAIGHRVLFFSLEMGKRQIVTRMFSTISEISGTAIRRGDLTDSHLAKIDRTGEYLSSLPIDINDTAGLSITEIKSISSLEAAKSPLGLVVVDYMQLSNAVVKGGNREQEVATISRGLKGIAKDLDCPVIALSQLSRNLENRADKRPVLADLRESGSIEQDADVVMFIYRDEVYNTSPDNPSKGIAEIIIAKQRNGPIGTERLLFQGEFSRFKDLSRSEY